MEPNGKRERAAANDGAAATRCEGLEALAALMLCVDEARWASLARPTARGLGLLILGQLELIAG